MANPDTDYGQKLKHTFKYGEQRRTLWLNTHSKDDFGRHRSAILYGMNVEAISASRVRVAPGAVVTPYGTRFFFEQYSDPSNPSFNEVDVNVEANAFGLSAQFPIVVCVYLKFIIDDTRRVDAVEQSSDFDTSKIAFKAKVVPYDREDVHPSVNLAPRDPILLDRIQDQAQEFEKGADIDFTKPSVDFFDPSSVQNAALQFGEIPLAYIIIGANPENGVLPTGLQDPGVEIVQCKNLFAAIGDILGQDVFFGRHGKRIVPTPSTVTASALRQGLGTSTVGSNATVPLASPHYGTGEPVETKISPIGSGTDKVDQRSLSDQDKDSWRDSLWDTYRQPNLLRDGDGVIWALRRLDVVLRQWMNRTGDQSLVSIVQDGQVTTPAAYTITNVTLGTGPAGTDEIFIDGLTDVSWVSSAAQVSQGNTNDGSYTVVSVSGSSIRVAGGSLTLATGGGSITVAAATSTPPKHVRPMMTLDAILYHFAGGDNPATNLNRIEYADNAPNSGSNPVNHAVKSGRAAHVPQSLENAQATGFGDSHLNAISALDLSVYHVLGDVFGRDFVRRALRRSQSWRSGSGLNSVVLGPDLASVDLALRIDDGPIGRLPIADANADGKTKLENRPTVTGPVEDAYFTFDPVYGAIEGLADRAQAGSRNWLRNPTFHTGDGANPLYWTLAGPSYLRTLLAPTMEMYQAQVTLTAGYVGQTLPFGSAIVNELMATANLMHVAVTMRVVSGTVRIGVRGLDALDATVFEVSRPGITPSTTFDNYGCLFRLKDPLPTTVTKLFIFIDGSAGAEVRLLGASLGCGIPPTVPGIDNNFFEFLSREGGETSAMRGDTLLGGHEILGGSLRADVIFEDLPPGKVNEIGGPLPTITGAGQSPYLGSTVGMVETMRKLLDRSERDPSVNLLRNPAFTDREQIVVSGPAVPPSRLVFRADGSWVVPAGITSLSIDLLGAGGGGAGGAAGSITTGGGGGGGGQAGQRQKQTIAVTPGETITFTIGTAGNGGAVGAPGAPGANSTLTYTSGTITATGGAAGQAGSGSTGGLGATNAGNGGDGGNDPVVATDGAAGSGLGAGQGGDAQATVTDGGGGGGGEGYGILAGGSAEQAKGGDGGAPGLPGGAGHNGGGGGGGGGAKANGAAAAGAPGGNGFLSIDYGGGSGTLETFTQLPLDWSLSSSGGDVNRFTSSFVDIKAGPNGAALVGYEAVLFIPSGVALAQVMADVDGTVFDRLKALKTISFAGLLNCAGPGGTRVRLDVWNGAYQGVGASVVASAEKELAPGFSGPVAMSLDITKVSTAPRMSLVLQIDGTAAQPINIVSIGGPGNSEILLAAAANSNWVGSQIAIAQGNANDGVHLITGVTGNIVTVAALPLPTGAVGTVTIAATGFTVVGNMNVTFGMPRLEPVDGAMTTVVRRAGGKAGEMRGDLFGGMHRAREWADPVDPQDLVTLSYAVNTFGLRGDPLDFVVDTDPYFPMIGGDPANRYTMPDGFWPGGTRTEGGAWELWIPAVSPDGYPLTSIWYGTRHGEPWGDDWDHGAFQGLEIIPFGPGMVSLGSAHIGSLGCEMISGGCVPPYMQTGADAPRISGVPAIYDGYIEAPPLYIAKTNNYDDIASSYVAMADIYSYSYKTEADGASGDRFTSIVFARKWNTRFAAFSWVANRHVHCVAHHWYFHLANSSSHHDGSNKWTTCARFNVRLLKSVFQQGGVNPYMIRVRRLSASPTPVSIGRCHVWWEYANQHGRIKSPLAPSPWG